MITRLGIIGGVGPLATAHFYRRLIERTPVADDAAHLPVVLASEQVPSRVAHLRGNGPSPVPALVRAARILAGAGADAIVIPSATTHAYRDEVVAAVDVPILDLYAAVDDRLTTSGLSRPVLLATSPTAALRLYERRFSRSVRPLYPEPAAQREIDGLIDGVKSGRPVAGLTARLVDLLAAAPWPAGADSVVLACTELPVIAPPANPVALPLVDVTDVLADAVLRQWVAGGAPCAA